MRTCSQTKTTLAEAGFAPDLGERLEAGVRDGRFKNLHAVLVLRGGKLVLERYYEGHDERWGRPRGWVTFAPEELHDLGSVTKSILGLLYGMALAEGKCPCSMPRCSSSSPSTRISPPSPCGGA